MIRVAFEGVGFFVCLAAVLSLLLIGCGQEPVARPAPPRPEVVAVREVCTVSFQPDGSLACVCVEAP